MRAVPIDDEVHTTEDILKFVQHELEGGDAEHMVDDVAQSAQTSFECAALLCRELQDPRKLKSAAAQADFIRRLPGAPLYASYRVILLMNFDEEDIQLLKVFRCLMGWIHSFRSPQSRAVIREIATLLLSGPQETSDADRILSSLGSLLSGTGPSDDNSPVSPLHASLRDFFEDPVESGSFYIHLGPRIHEDLSWACLKLMNSHLKFNICALESPFIPNNEIDDLDRRIQKYISPGLRYACFSAPYHMEESLASSGLSKTLMRAIVFHRGTFIVVMVIVLIVTNITTAVLLLSISAVLFLHCANLGIPEVFRKPEKSVPFRREASFLRRAAFEMSAEIHFLLRRMLSCRVHSPMIDKCRVSLSRYLSSGEGRDVTKQLKLFAEEYFLYWLEAHSWMQSDHDAPEAQLPLFLGFTKSKGFADLYAVFCDFIKFEKWFREGYRTSAPQLYYSGLTFAPTNSIISQIYRHKFHHLVADTQGCDLDWPSSDPLVIRGEHTSFVFSPKGDRIASSARFRGSIQIWNSETGEQLNEICVADEPLVIFDSSIAFSQDGTQLMACAMTIGAQIHRPNLVTWDLNTGQKIGRSYVEPDKAQFLHSNWSSPSDTSLMRKYWHESIMQELDQNDPQYSTTSVAISVERRLIALGLSNGDILVWDSFAKKRVCMFSGHQEDPCPGKVLAGLTFASIAFSPDGRCIASCLSQDGVIRLWEPSAGKQVGGIQTRHEGGVTSVLFSHNRKRIASAGKDGMIIIWDVATGLSLWKALVEYKVDRIVMGFSPDERRLASLCNGKIRLWEMPTEDEYLSVGLAPPPSKTSSKSDFSRQRFKARDIRSKGEIETTHRKVIIPLAFAANNTITSAAYELSEAHSKWDDLLGWRTLWERQSTSRSCLAISPDGTLLALSAPVATQASSNPGDAGTVITVRDTNTAKGITEIRIEGHITTTDVVFSMDGAQIAVGLREYAHYGSIAVFEVKTGRRMAELAVHDFQVTSHMLLASYRARCGRREGWNGDGHNLEFSSVSISSDGQRIAAASNDARIRIWDVTTSSVVCVMHGSDEPITCLTFSPDGVYIASGSDASDAVSFRSAGTIRIWNASTGQQVGKPVQGHESYVHSIVFSPDGSRLASGSGDGTVRIWRLDIQHYLYRSRDLMGKEREWMEHAGGKSTPRVLWIPHRYRGHAFIMAPSPCEDIIASNDDPTIALRFVGSESMAARWVNQSSSI
ncbi:hypothetical protein HGRIS_014480 [Hohenbuehelia grisea]|uniref:Uncharacterized protein n=1 Tax=Hohenbuehelia grisea TaxID=104357 RepID=A0ABR3JVS3_9AGAR